MGCCGSGRCGLSDGHQNKVLLPVKPIIRASILSVISSGQELRQHPLSKQPICMALFQTCALQPSWRPHRDGVLDRVW
eukprot:CAMPEP_0174286938 /NCGR_PEP_ID=MMETSP0809-20121228/13809_1 /TAXON_ID=73025 ORGANISM="Eutreptiella gymnastica-like, Strain CCMP1594" /NCGR_SAMPLE_ID=MMETSP0809 /ASSEMBLY_ACC=CAM_ASM_000658 /LENGTH=77 /DNA_ID=CAMNT_0015383231 /DNA_START=36 /DNA_END=266 /DNA_ORIENTATION=-